MLIDKTRQQLREARNEVEYSSWYAWLQNAESAYTIHDSGEPPEPKTPGQLVSNLLDDVNRRLAKLRSES